MQYSIVQLILSKKLIINKNLKKPVYQQIYDQVIEGINGGTFTNGHHLPSINKVAQENHLARETVVKAFKRLQEKGIIKAVHGKGYYVSTERINIPHRIFLLFDTLSAYKEILYEAIKEEFGENVNIDIFFHHFNPNTFETLIKEASGNYTAYLVLPFDHPNITQMLEPIPFDKLFMLDRWPRFYKNPFHGVYQDFYKDITEALNPLTKKIRSYTKLVLVFRDLLTEIPKELLEGFEAYCKENKIEYQILKRSLKRNEIEKNTAYITIDDNDLVELVEEANTQNWIPGKDIGILSYNDTPLKKVVAKGITVISTNFSAMGKRVAQLVINNEKSGIANSSALIDRGSF